MLRTIATMSRLDLSASAYDCLSHRYHQRGLCTRLGCHSEIGLYCAQTSAKTQVQFIPRRHPRNRQGPAGGCMGLPAFPSLLTLHGGSVMVSPEPPGGDHALSGERSAAGASPWHGMLSISRRPWRRGSDGHPFACRPYGCSRSAHNSSVLSSG